MLKQLKNYIVAGVLVSSLIPIQVKDIKSLSDYMTKEFIYKSEKKGEDYWQTPEETAKLKTFDCEDASFFSEKVLKDLGYQDVKSMAIYGIENGKSYFHAICIFKINGKWKYMSNGYYVYFKEFNTITDMIKFECPEWFWYATIELPHKFKEKYYRGKNEL
jgi:hypothetical protein